MNEVWDIYNSDGKRTKKTILRGYSSLAAGEYHLVVHIWIISSTGALLIQRRADDKKLMPGEWAATGGAAIAGEDSFSAAKRELFEELGITSDADSLKKLVRFKRRNSFVDVWAIKMNMSVFDMKLQKSEVAEARWVNRDTLKSMIDNGIYHNYGKEYFDTVFEKIDEFTGAMV